MFIFRLNDEIVLWIFDDETENTHNFRIELRPYFVYGSITGYDHLRPCKKNHYYLLNLIWNVHEAAKCYDSIAIASLLVLAGAGKHLN